MSLDDFISDENRPPDLDPEPPQEFDSWVEAEPEDPDWYTKMRAKRMSLDNETFDKEEELLLVRNSDESDTHLVCNNYVDLDELQ